MHGDGERSSGPGRPRDAAIDVAILTAAQRHLANTGYEAMSLSAVAADANTTRQALYRRFPTKAQLATAAIAALSAAIDRPASDDPFTDLVGELEDFARAMAGPTGLAMAGTMLQGTAERELVELYRDRLVRPRAERLRAVLERALRHGHVDHDADVELAVTLLTGSWYALGLAGTPPPPDWAARVASLAWQALGGPRRGTLQH
ncbi:MAG: TetR family transcriptional regulator [Acidimicrobiia bacterium]|nr:TetR family transcriptional regulator [Acidimicrobiia bacterium]